MDSKAFQAADPFILSFFLPTLPLSLPRQQNDLHRTNKGSSFRWGSSAVEGVDDGAQEEGGEGAHLRDTQQQDIFHLSHWV